MEINYKSEKWRRVTSGVQAIPIPTLVRQIKAEPEEPRAPT